ncbi:MAG: flagellar hook-associated protein 3 [Lachnospiraceae bacterium]|nr:flagellar hook-associated protein 3 [Lachnospiraceae bacterium]
MRITNSMIMNNAGGNINGTKVLVDKRNTQMTTQKKIQRPSEDPVIAVRSLRLQTTLSKVNQYYERNIPDAESWMNVTETALSNIKDIITDMRTLANRGATETLTQDDRNTILSQMKALQEQVYNEGNADYAGRTVFTGYRTDKSLTFMSEDKHTAYNITEPLTADMIKQKRFYNNTVTVPNTKAQVNGEAWVDGRTHTDLEDELKSMTIEKSDLYTLRLAYDDINTIQEIRCTYTLPGQTTSQSEDSNNTTSNIPVTVYDNEAAWATAKGNKKVVDDNEIIFIKETGEMILGNTLASKYMTGNASIEVDYSKIGFKSGELRPEYYFDCVQLTDSEGAGVGSEGHVFDPNYSDTTYNETTYGSVLQAAIQHAYDVNRNAVSGKPITSDDVGFFFDKLSDDGELKRYDINYTVAQNQDLTVNLEAGECIDHNIYQDMGDMISAIEWAISAHEKVDKIKTMQKQDQFADETSQKNLQMWLDVAQKEADYYDDNLSKLYSSQLGVCDSYLEDVNLSITKMGCKGDQLEMTKTRMSNQQETVQELQSTNDDMDLSDIILRYTAAHTAYQSSLTAAGKLGQQTLLNYI